MRIFWTFVILLALTAGFGGGWYWADRLPVGASEMSGAEKLDADIFRPMEIGPVYAQGRILPAAGIINVVAPPGQRIAAILVSEGDQVVGGETELATFAGQPKLQTQVELAESQGEDALRELEQQIMAAEGQVKLAEKQVTAAELQLEMARADQLLKIKEQQLQAANEKLDRLRQLEKDPVTRIYVSRDAIFDQELALAEADSQLNLAQQQQQQAIDTAELNRESAELAWQQARSALRQLVDLRNENRTLQLTQKLARQAAREGELIAPADGTVLRVFGKPGEAMVQTPLMQIGDLSKLTCQAEVVDRLIPSVAIGQAVSITSPALNQPISGRISHIGRVVISGLMNDPNPLAMVDKRVVEVTISIDEVDANVAERLINLQVTVQIHTEPSTATTTGDVALADSGLHPDDLQ